jgi:hypothetical protein
MQYTEEVKLNDGTVEVTFDHDKGFKGSRDEPPEPECVEIVKVVYQGIDITPILGNEAFEELEEKLLRLAEERTQGEREMRADAEYEELKDRRHGL